MFRIPIIRSIALEGPVLKNITPGFIVILRDFKFERIGVLF